MNTKNITKFIVAVALTLAVMFTTGVSDNFLDTAMTPQAYAGCVGSGANGGGGC